MLFWQRIERSFGESERAVLGHERRSPLATTMHPVPLKATDRGTLDEPRRDTFDSRPTLAGGTLWDWATSYLLIEI